MLPRLIIFILIASLAPPALALAMQDEHMFTVPENRQEQWLARKNMVNHELRVCLEHCGNDPECISRCSDVYANRLLKEYKDLLYQDVVQAAKEDKLDYKLYESCPLCGMNREKFAHSRMLIRYDDGSVFPSCSIHCAAVDMALHIDKAPMEMLVGDFNTQSLINAENAYWVIGGSKPGVMTKRAKWAFAEKDAAEKYIAEFGGRMASFEDAVKASFEDMYEDTLMIRNKRKNMRMKMNMK